MRGDSYLKCCFGKPRAPSESHMYHNRHGTACTHLTAALGSELWFAMSTPGTMVCTGGEPTRKQRLCSTDVAHCMSSQLHLISSSFSLSDCIKTIQITMMCRTCSQNLMLSAILNCLQCTNSKFSTAFSLHGERERMHAMAASKSLCTGQVVPWTIIITICAQDQV